VRDAVGLATTGEWITATLWSAALQRRFLMRTERLFSTLVRALLVSMRPTIPWPHAPTHQLSNRGTYFVTAGTYLKANYFYAPQRLDVLHRGLLSVTRDFSRDLEAWAVFSNHYHFVAHSPGIRKTPAGSPEC
jgi:hypothetical protein